MTPTSCTFFSFLDLRFPWNRILVNVVKFYFILLYGHVSKGLETNKFKNLIG